MNKTENELLNLLCEIGNPKLAIKIKKKIATLHKQSALDIIIQSYLPKCKRVEVINTNGKAYSNTNCNAVQVELKDNNKTLVIWVNEK